MAKMRRSAGEEPHDDWQPRFGDDQRVQKWHPPFGETHVKYHIYRGGGGRNPIIWGANHHGTYQGSEMVKSPIRSGEHPDIEVPVYSTQDEPEQLGRFRTPEQARAAAEEHYTENYGRPPAHDYDINRIMREEGFQ